MKVEGVEGMGFNFRKSINIAKGVRVNLSKSGPSISFGKTGMRFSVNSKGQARGTVGIPGTGVHYRKQVNVFNSIKRFFKPDENQVQEGLEEPLTEGQLTAEESNMTQQQLYENYIEQIKNVHKEADEPLDWEEIQRTQNELTPESKELKELAGLVLAGDDEAYLRVVEEMQPFDDLTEFGSDFEVGITVDGFLGVTFNVHSDSVVPSEVPTVLKSGKLSVKPMTMTMHNTLVRDYVTSTTFRVARDLFALLPVDRIVINAEESMVNPATGHKEEMTLLSVIFDREQFEKLNFEGIVPWEALNNFEHAMTFKPRSGLVPVLPLK